MTSHRHNSRRSRHSGGALISKIALAVVLLFVAGLTVYALKQSLNNDSGKPDTAPAAEADTHGGIPSARYLSYVTSENPIDEEMIDYEGFMVSFNPKAHVPNYVVWELTADKVNASETSRESSSFSPDYAVDGCATLDDYRHSGFDRGHMVPAADMRWSKTAMDNCHYLTNIAPQTHDLNAGPWQTVERNCRKWVQRDSALIIACGPILTDKLTRTIGPSKVVVPDRFFKVVLAPYTNPPRGIAFIMNNFDTSGGAQQMAVSIDEVEAVTGFDFFAALPDEIENEVEKQHNYQLWQKLKK